MTRNRVWMGNAGFACALMALMAFALPAAGQKHSKQKNCCGQTQKAAQFVLERSEEEKKKFGARVESILSGEQTAKGEWGILIVDEKSGKVLFDLNADRYFVPASNMKLFTTAFALATLGPDYRFRTTLQVLHAPTADGKIEGELFLEGRGDPNLSNRKFPFDGKEEFDGPPEKVLAELADQLLAKGVKEISGGIVGDDSYFPRERYPSGWEIDDMVWEYGAPVSAIVVDDNTVTLTLTPGEKEGDDVLTEISPATPDFVVDNLVATSGATIKPDLTLTREPGSNKVTVRGTLPTNSKPRKLVLAIQNPPLHAAAMLKRLLEAKGVVVKGAALDESAVGIPTESPPPTALAEHVSIPLSDSIKLVNKISQNLHTEVLLRASVLKTCEQGKFDDVWLECIKLKPETIVGAVQDFYAKAGIAAGDVVQSDGSGLSRHDLATPRAFVALLGYAAKQKWFPAFYDSLPVAGLDGTLEDRLKNSSATMRIHAKSGSLEHVRTRSGYAELPNGRRLIFSFMSNNMGSKGHEATDALDAISAAMVEEFGGEPAGCCKRKE